jgi:hypothetical protein
MLSSFVERWPKSVGLVAYPEDTPGLPVVPNVFYRQFPDWFLPWKDSLKNDRAAHGNDPKHNRRKAKHDYRRDCVRFSHKIAAITDAATTEPLPKWLIWLDADIYTHTEVTVDWLHSLHPDGEYMAWLERKGSHPECGFMIFNCEDPVHFPFMNALRHVYESKQVLKMPETHDSFVIQQIAQDFERRGLMQTPHNLSGEHNRYHHPFIRCELGSRMDHMKGPRKKLGGSPQSEVAKFRKEDYWKSNRRKFRREGN